MQEHLFSISLPLQPLPIHRLDEDAHRHVLFLIDDQIKRSLGARCGRGRKPREVLDRGGARRRRNGRGHPIWSSVYCEADQMVYSLP